MDPTIMTLPGFTVVGIRYRGCNALGEVRELWPDLIDRFDEIESILPGGAYGVIGNYAGRVNGMGNYDATKGEFDYLAGLAVDEIEYLPEGMDYWQIPEQTYAIFKFLFSELGEAYRIAYQQWLPSSGYRYSGGPELEHYPEEFDPEDESSEMELWVPITR